MRKKTGTREWAEANKNICKGCKHNCLYCYARHNALRFGQIKNKDEWENMKLNEVKLNELPRNLHGKRIMFPTTHDIFPERVPGGNQLMRGSGRMIKILTKKGLDDLINNVFTSPAKCPPLQKHYDYRGHNLNIWGETHNCLGCFKNIIVSLPEIDVYVTPDFIDENTGGIEAASRIYVLKHLKTIILPDKESYSTMETNCGNKCVACGGYSLCVKREKNVVSKMFSSLDKSEKNLNVLLVCGYAHFERICEMTEKKIREECDGGSKE